MFIHYEHTDTFGGEANYAWVNRGTIEAKEDVTDLQAVRRVKKALSLNGVKCDRDNHGDIIVLKPRGYCSIVFIDISPEGTAND